jgi:hypothetical protein
MTTTERPRTRDGRLMSELTMQELIEELGKEMALLPAALERYQALKRA